MHYELYYWPGIQGLGEFVRLTLEDAGAEYVDVAHLPKRGMPALIQKRLTESAYIVRMEIGRYLPMDLKLLILSNPMNYPLTFSPCC